MLVILFHFWFKNNPKINAFYFFFFFNDTATTEIYTLSLHDALPILTYFGVTRYATVQFEQYGSLEQVRSEEHTSELQSRPHLVCRLLLEKKKFPNISIDSTSDCIQ